MIWDEDVDKVRAEIKVLLKDNQALTFRVKPTQWPGTIGDASKEVKDVGADESAVSIATSALRRSIGRNERHAGRSSLLSYEVRFEEVL